MVIWVLKIIAFVLVVLFIFSALHAIHFINSGMLRVKDEYKILVRVVPFLFLVKRIVDLYNWKVQATSQKQKGTKVTISFQ